MATTRDKYELPIAVEDSPTKLAMRLGLKANSVSSLICRGYKGFQKVLIDEDDE